MDANFKLNLRSSHKEISTNLDCQEYNYIDKTQKI